jgi:hypothetical protein
MTPAMVRRIGEMVQAGATVVGPKPAFSPSLVDQPKADEEVQRLAGAIWGDSDGRQTAPRSYGRGRIFQGQPLSEILAACGIPADVATPADRPLVRHIHRRLQDGELYFLASSSPQFQAMDVAFRTTAGSPQLWDPISGQIRPLPEYRRANGQTIIPLQFEPRQSYFVLFNKQGKPAGSQVEGRSGKPLGATANFPRFRTLSELAGAWDVSFDPKWGGPAQVTFEKLEDWTKRPESGIKYYSGKATYRRNFDLPAAALGGKLYLDLGQLRNVAAVRLNGQALGIVWCAPWRVEITATVRPARNQLEIDVVNLWPNRMIGDEQLPADGDYSKTGWILIKRLPDWFAQGQPRTSGRYTFSIHQPWAKDSALFESGLLGPVTIRAAE